jgi:ABC-type antimicrobial peptide transport system permease subunit
LSDTFKALLVAVIGSKTANELFGPLNPVGQSVRIKNIPFTIVGLLESKGAGMGAANQDDRVPIPYTTAMKRLTGDCYLRSVNVQSGGRWRVSSRTGLWRLISLGGWRRRDLKILQELFLHEATADADQNYQNQPDGHHREIPFKNPLLRGSHRSAAIWANAGAVAYRFLAFMTIYECHKYSGL